MKNQSKVIIICLFVILFLISLYLDIFCGYNNLNISDVFGLLTGKEDLNTQILGIIRLPKVIKAIIAGSCLAIAGMFLQTVTKNPLVEPYFTGVSSGAGLALVVGILLNLNPAYLPLIGFLGAMAISIMVILLTGINKFSLVKLILVGLSINIFVSSMISSLILFNKAKSHTLLLVLTGNINTSTAVLRPLLILFILGIVLCIIIVPKLNFMILDGDIIKAISPRANFYFVFVVVLSSFIASLSVCAAGILGFVGIIIPHLSKLIIGAQFKWLFILNILLGATIVLFCDFISRNILYPSELPLGLVIAIVGAPIFIIFLVIRGNQFYA